MTNYGKDVLIGDGGTVLVTPGGGGTGVIEGWGGLTCGDGGTSLITDQFGWG